MAEPFCKKFQLVLKIVNKVLMPEAQRNNISLLEALEKLSYQNDNISEIFEKIPKEIIELLKNPEKYTGYAQEKAQEISYEVSQIFLSD